MAKIVFIHYPLLCGRDGGECSICEEAKGNGNAPDCVNSRGFSDVPKALVKESNKIEFSGFDGDGYWTLRVGRRMFSGATSKIKLLKIDGILIYSEDEGADSNG